MMDDGGGKVLVLADEERHCPLPEGEGDERALLQRAAVLEVGQPKIRHFAIDEMKAIEHLRRFT
jgi:hypothetical protein